VEAELMPLCEKGEPAMSNLNDTQSILLSKAGQRDSGSLYPLPATLLDAGGAATKAVAALIKRALAEERETEDAASVVREDADFRYGIFITASGLAAIGLGEEADAPAVVETVLPSVLQPERQTKSASVIVLLERGDGATLPELISATGWLPHTTRAALTGLRKKGHAIERSKRDEVTCYRIVVAG
jgi:hypothetical protein